MKKIKEQIREAILNIPLASASMVVEEKGLLFRLNPDFIDSLVEVFLSEIKKAEYRGFKKGYKSQIRIATVEK